MTDTVVIGVAAAGGMLGFGIAVLLLCTMCSYKLRRSREKFVQEKKAKLAAQAQAQALRQASQKRDTRVVSHVAVDVDNRHTMSRQPADVVDSALERTAIIEPGNKYAGELLVPPHDESNEKFSDNSSSIDMSSLHSSERSATESNHRTSQQSKPMRRLSEIEAQRVGDDNHDQSVHMDKGQLNHFMGNNVDDDSSVERGFDKLLAEFSDDSSWDSSCSGGLP